MEEEKLTKYEIREQERDRQQAEDEAKRLQIPLVERLRDCGPFLASDGMMSYASPDYRDAHEAADLIEKLTSVIGSAQTLINKSLQESAMLRWDHFNVKDVRAVLAILEKGLKEIEDE